jgi:hypothetical protein
MLREKQYLSWSQFSLWQSSKREYYKRYALNEDRSNNKFFDKGRELSEALEYGENGISTDDLLAVVLEAIPKLDIMEMRIDATLSNGEKTLCYLDSASIDKTEFYEYKSGKVPWTQERVDKHDQLVFYALSIFRLTGEVPTCKLFWIETEETEQGLKYTGLVESFDRGFTIKEILEFEKKVIKTIEDIEDFEYLELELRDEVVDRYIYLIESIKEMQQEADLIKLDIQVQMEADDIKYASATNGKFSVSERKTWVYTQSLIEAKAEMAKKIKIAESQEQKSGLAKQEISTSLRFSLNKVK